MRRIMLLAVSIAFVSGPASADEVEIRPDFARCGTSCQDEFDSIAKDLVATIDYKALGPAEASGVTGIGVGVALSYVPVDNEADWRAVTGEDISALGMAGVQITKGLPLDIDVGAFYSTVPDTNIDLYGAEVRYAFMPGSTVAPALALRASYVAVTGIESFDLSSTAVDLSLSKGFTLVTPYIGVGYVMGEADPDDATTLVTNIDKSEVEETKVYLGMRLSLGLLEMTPEVGQVGDNLTYNLRLGFSI